MKHEVYELRKTPQLKITIDKVNLHIIDVFDPKNSGTYSWNDIKSIELNKEKINWIFSIFSGLIDLFAGTAASKVYKFKSNLKIVLDTEAYTAVEIITKKNTTKIFIISNKDNSTDKNHIIKIGNKEYNWKGSYYYK